ncbi:sensor histidine kinase [Actinoplanes bogorensis]|uniref:Sensor histidine kinase n=1 Tax=Paractinoplanes bogorensis TaxID=1610840 RepID=A0ABS5YIQ7_9ACTN|nr:sensor histidine kinase [Actinoplanes bogorensis]MBU2662628.1 sensor histidine kinase [Actinoplanes bogorensis]
MTTTWLPFTVALLLLAAAVVVLRRQPAPIVVLLGATVVTGLAAAVVRTTAGPGPVADRLWVLAVVVLLPVALVLFPDGRPPPGLGWTAVAVVAVSGGIAVLFPSPYAFSQLSEVAAYLLVLAVQWWRFEHSGREARRQLQWLALGAVPGPVLATIMSFAVAHEVAAVVFVVVWAVFLICLCVGLIAPGRWDVRAVILSVSVHGLTVLLVTSVFAAVLAGLEAFAGPGLDPAPGALGLIAAACALGYAPFARLFRQILEVLLFGARRDPIQAAWEAGDRLGDDPVPALRSLRESLALPYAALTDHAGEPVAVSGRPAEQVVRRPLPDGAGALEVGLRPGQFGLLRADEQVLAVLTPALAQLMHARRLRTELQTSRTAVVESVEEERRRLRRDLHDGLGPRLTGIAYASDAAGNVLARDPGRAADLIAGVRTEAGEAIVEIRRLVEGLRPPSLDQMGLERTIRQHARHLLRPDGRPVTVDVRVPGPLPGLGAAVEVTAYRIVVEALTNAARHSGGDSATVTLRLDDSDLAVEVSDDGPSREPWVPGCGLTSMRERVEMLGGSLTAGAATISVRLPLPPD